MPSFPINEEVIPECLILKASEFSSPNTSELHGQSHWQVSNLPDDFSTPVAESWKNFENWYFEEDTQANDDLTDEKIIGLDENTAYWWRVRYRDRALNWSDWSVPVFFNTGASIALPNLIMNPGAEEGLEHWTVLEGVVEALTDGVCDGVAPHSGDNYLAVGGLCEHSAIAQCVQDIDVSTFADSIDLGNLPVNFGGFLSNFGGSDLPEMKLVFLDQASFELGESITLSTLNPSWTLLSESTSIPEQTRTIRVELKGTRNAGTDNDSYFDDLFLTLGSNDIDCNVMTSIITPPFLIPRLEILPNPVESVGTIILPSEQFSSIKLFVVDINGAKIHCPATYEAGKIYFEKGSLNPGTYIFWVREKGVLIGTGKIIII